MSSISDYLQGDEYVVSICGDGDRIEFSEERLDDKKIVKFKDCRIKQLEIKNISGYVLNFQNSNIERLLFYKGDFKKVSFSSTNIHETIFEEVKIESNIEFRDSQIELLIFTDFKEKVDLKFYTERTNINNLKIRRMEMVDIEINSAIVGSIESLKMPQCCIKNKGRLDELYIEELEDGQIRDIVKASNLQLTGGKKNISNIEKSNLSMMLALNKAYDNRKKYSEMDDCLYNIRNMECKLKIKKEKKLYQKCRYVIYYIILGKMFGWGINILNNIMTMIVTILLFGILNCKYYEGSEQWFWPRVFRCMQISVNRFFNIMDIEIETLQKFASVQVICGIVMITIMTGVLVRKIIR